MRKKTTKKYISDFMKKYRLGKKIDWKKKYFKEIIRTSIPSGRKYPVLITCEYCGYIFPTMIRTVCVVCETILREEYHTTKLTKQHPKYLAVIDKLKQMNDDWPIKG